MMKRIFDLAISFFLIILFLPLFPVISLLIKIEDGGSVFFLQERIGKDGKIFRMLKFRTMKENSPLTSLITIKNDPRLTRTGKLLRRFHLDEIPQLFNVLKGDMSLVGPRPESPIFKDAFSGKYEKILHLKPGITGITQILFRKESEMIPEGVNPHEFYREKILPLKLSSDLQYVEKRSMFYDIKILFRTCFIILEELFEGRNAQTRTEGSH